MTTEEMKTSKFPYDLQGMKDGRLTFKRKEFTVAQVFTRYGVGYSFEEDDTDPRTIWNHKGEWDDATRRFKDYDGEVYEVGQRVEVVLSHRTYTKKDGGTGESREIVRHRKLNTDHSPAQVVGVGQSKEDWTPPPTPKDSVDSRILKNSALNNLTSLLAARSSSAKTISTDLLDVWTEALHHAMQGQPLFQDDDVEFQRYKNEVISPPEVPEEQASFDDIEDPNYEGLYKQLLIDHFGIENSDEAKAWLQENVGEPDSYENAKAYYAAAYIIGKRLLGGK